MRRVSCLAGLAGSPALLAAPGAGAASLESVGSFAQPIFVSSDPDDPDRLFVVEREGTVRAIEGGDAGLFADLTHLVSCCAGERGLLSIALAPDFPSSGRFYAAYTGTVAAGGEVGDIHVDAFHHDGAGELVRERVLSIGHIDFSNHNGGQLQFGPDGHLYPAREPVRRQATQPELHRPLPPAAEAQRELQGVVSAARACREHPLAQGDDSGRSPLRLSFRRPVSRTAAARSP